MSVLVALAGASSPARGDAFFSETSFNPGSWNALPTYSSLPIADGAVYSASSGPVMILGDSMRQTFSMNRGSQGSDSLWSPIQFTGWTYDLSIQGTVVAGLGLCALLASRRCRVG